MREQDPRLSSTAAFLCASVMETGQVADGDPISTLMMLSAMQEADVCPGSAASLSHQFGVARETAPRRVELLREAGFFAPVSRVDEDPELVERYELSALSVMLADLVLQHAESWRAQGGLQETEAPLVP